MNISLLKEKSTRPISLLNLSNLNSSNSNTTPIVTSGIVFIDPKVDDYEMLMAGVTPGLEVVLLDGSHNGIAQITQALNRHRGLSSLHLVAHGEPGSLWLGNGLVNSNTLDQQKDELHSWATALAPDADILLYGCKVAAGEKGQHFVQLLGQITGADVAASKNLMGSAALGGDWELEVKIGLVEAPIAFGAETVEAYSAVLTTRRVSVGSSGTQGNSYSESPSISADGRYVAFTSYASNLVSGDTNGSFDIFVYDTVSNTTHRVSVSSNGTQGNNDSRDASISADGHYVAFYSHANNLVSGDTNNSKDIFVYDTVANTTRRVSVADNGTQGNSYSESPSISADGRYVAFQSNASNLVSGDTNNTYDIFLYDTVANTTRRVSVADNGTQGNKSSESPSISADGRYVAFYSHASNLVSDDTNDWSDIFVYDTVSNTTRRVSVADNGTQGNSYSSSPSISANGRYVAFQSNASNLVSGDTNNQGDIFLYDTVSNTIRRVSVDSNGIQGQDNNNSMSYNSMSYTGFPSISADGSRVAFESSASNLTSGDTNNAYDIFLYDSNSGTQNPWTGTPGNDTYTYTGTDNFKGYGLAGKDTIVGGIANDILDGGTGNDSLRGGKGNDTYYVDSTGDVVTENPNEGTDTVYTSIVNGYTLAANLENLTLLRGARNSYGNNLNNIINGNAGRNYLDGGTGNDTINGAGGNDNIVGGYGNDSLLGGKGNDYLMGAQENDYLTGGKGNDVLDGYGGSSNEVDTLVGGGGADIFRLGVEQASRISYRGNGDSYAIIADFSRPQGDKIDILGSSSNFSQYSFTQSGADTQILYQNDVIAVVQNSIATSFTQSDFI